MIDLIKKTLLAGVGAVVVTNEKVEAALDEFVKQGKVSTAEARAMAAKIAADGKREFEAASGQLNDKLRDLFARHDRAIQERIAALEARVTKLELAALGTKNQSDPAKSD